jgi:hypothetical protein
VAEETPKARDENERIAESVEEQVKAEMGEQAGAQPGESWEQTARRIEARMKSEMASWLGVRRDASWSEVGQALESRTKEAFGGWAGATPSDDWETVGRKIDARIRREAAQRTGVEGEEADWEAIAHQVDRRVRTGLGGWVGAPPDADWRTVAGRYRGRVSDEMSQRFGPRQSQGTSQEGEGGEHVRREEIRVSGEDLVAKVKELIHEGNVRRVIIKQDDRVLIEFPLTLGVVGVVLAPTLAAIGALAALIAEATIVVERREP